MNKADTSIDQRREAMRAIAKDPRNWMTKEEQEAFSASDFEDPEMWIQTTYGVSSSNWIAIKIATTKLQQSTLETERPCPLQTITEIRDEKRKRRAEKELRNQELKLLGSYTITTPTGREVTITKLSRSLTGDEEDIHRCQMCDDSCVSECLSYVIKKKIKYFSCVRCPEYELAECVVKALS